MGKNDCSVCLKKCRDGCIYCQTCGTWVHYRCNDIRGDLKSNWENKDALEYVCVRCRSDVEGQFDFLMGLERLKKGAKLGIVAYRKYVQRELLFAFDEQYTKNIPLHCDFSNHVPDAVANEILFRHHINKKIALTSTGDGDCLFNAISTLVYGNESRSIELRYRCCLKMIEGKDKIVQHELYPRLCLLSPDYDHDCLSCSRIGSYSSVWRMMALANALSIPIQSVYPFVNGEKHLAPSTLNTVFYPDNKPSELEPISVMWTTLSVPKSVPFGSKKKQVEWIPNHFVPLVNRIIQTDISSSSSDEEEIHSAPQNEPLQMEENVSTKPVSLSAEDTDSRVEDTDSSSFPSLSPTACDLSVILEEDEDDRVCADKAENIDVPTNTTTMTNGTSEVEDASVDREDQFEEDKSFTSFTPGPLGNSFMTIRSFLMTFRGPYTILPEIPCGRKDGYYFIIDNSENAKKREHGERSTFYDDCGAWGKPACPISFYIINNDKPVTVFKKDGVYCIEKKADRRRVFEPLSPQPPTRDILSVHRVYQTLKASLSGSKAFKRRITWIESIPDSFPHLRPDIALVEYIGTFPERRCHGNAKNPTKAKKYIRTKESAKNVMKTELKRNSVKCVEKIMNSTSENDQELHRDTKQLENFKYNIGKASRHLDKAANNAADHVVMVEEMTKTHPFVQSVITCKGLNHPAVTLFTDQQINDIKRFCCKSRGGTPLGIDKTYNIGEFHVTPTIYKDLSVIRRRTGDHPICFGPTFVHTNSSFKTYSFFLQQIAINLSASEMSNLVVGSDEELAFKTAIERTFNGATHVLCTRHLKQNLNKYMQDHAGYTLKDRQEVIGAIFGVDSLVEATDVDTYNTRLSRLRDRIDEKDSVVNVGDRKFRSYFEKKVLQTLESHVLQPVNEGKIHINWTNNNCESANHVLKNATNWKKTDIPKFITILHEIVLNDFKERCRSIRDMGNYKLHDTFSHHLIDIDHWTNLTEEQRKRRLTKFQTDKGKANPNTVVSTDGTRTVIRTASAGKKLNQVKRKRAERVRTPSAKRRLIQNDRGMHYHYVSDQF